jgi:hypothetical protein
MGGKGGGDAQATNQELVQMQMQQAQQAREANLQTQARLRQGVGEITSLFEGQPKGATKLDLSSIAQAQPYAGAAPSASARPNLPTPGASNLAPPPWGPGWSAGAGASSYGGRLAGGYTWGALGDTGGQTSYGIWDPSGNLVTDANSLDQLSKSQIFVGGDPSQKTGGFGSDFYNNYTNAITGYYMPQEDQQYQNARTSLNYSLARAGQLRSGVTGMDVGNLANQDIMARANIQSQADQQTGALRTTIQQDESNALNQLYSTEDPTVAANTAENMVANADLTKPMLNPMGALFNVAAVGVGNALSGFTNPYAYINPGAGGMGSVTTQGTGATASGAGGGASGTIAGF